MAILCSILLGMGLGGGLVYGLLRDRINAYKVRNQDLRHQLNDMQANFGDRLQSSLHQQRFDYESEISQLKARLFRAQFKTEISANLWSEDPAKAG